MESIWEEVTIIRRDKSLSKNVTVNIAGLGSISDDEAAHIMRAIMDVIEAKIGGETSYQYHIIKAMAEVDAEHEADAEARNARSKFKVVE